MKNLIIAVLLAIIFLGAAVVGRHHNSKVARIGDEDLPEVVHGDTLAVTPDGGIPDHAPGGRDGYAVDRYDAMGVTVLSDNGMTSLPRVYVGGALVVDAHPDGWKKVAVNYSISGDVSQVNSVAITGTAIHADNGYGGITKSIHAEPSTLNMRTLPYEIISVDPLITVFSVQGEHHIVTWTRAYPF